VIAHPDDELMPEQTRRFESWIARRERGEPIQYIVGETEFYGLPFLVTPTVLIPRPETEHLVEKALELAARFQAGSMQAAEELASAKGTGFVDRCIGNVLAAAPEAQYPLAPRFSVGKADSTWELRSPVGTEQDISCTGINSPYINAMESAGALAPEGSLSGSSPVIPPSIADLNAIRILDIGTGSGCIAVALARHLPHAAITAIDLSVPALAIARQNAKRNGVSSQIRFLQGDLLAPVAQEQFEIIVSNPPYVPLADRVTLAVEVRDHEPALALFAGPDGFDIFRRLIPAAYAALVPGGFLLLEIGCGQSQAVAALLAASGFRQIEFLPDLQSIPRVACARRP
jgi:methylase of polypeptide subunit release factors